MYTITSDAAKGVVILAVTGFLDAAAATGITAELDRHIDCMMRDCGAYDLLIDTTLGGAQTGAAVNTFAAAKDGLRPPAHIAIVYSSALVKLQTRRFLQRSDLRYFESRAKAAAWLSGELSL